MLCSKGVQLSPVSLSCTTQELISKLDRRCVWVLVKLKEHFTTVGLAGRFGDFYAWMCDAWMNHLGVKKLEIKPVFIMKGLHIMVPFLRCHWSTASSKDGWLASSPVCAVCVCVCVAVTSMATSGSKCQLSMYKWDLKCPHLHLWGITQPNISRIWLTILEAWPLSGSQRLCFACCVHACMIMPSCCCCSFSEQGHVAPAYVPSQLFPDPAMGMLGSKY